MAEQNSGHLVVVVGAGPAGIYGARKLAEAGHQVIIINRDIKPGGLVEYGIYWNKHKMKEGIRAQFRKILTDPRVHYVGNVKIGESADLTLDELRDVLKPAALIIAAGAQGTKSLGLKGEEAQGVFHAKDLVYHYNGLPPFSQQQFPIGQRVAIIGIGNVMVDIAHWLVHDLKTPEVIAIARRGPAQRAYTDNEIKAVAANIDVPALQAELERVAPHIHVDSAGLEKLFKDLTKYAHEPGKEGESPTRLTFRYLSAPTEILADETGRVCALRMEDTTLMPKGDDFSARGLATYHDLPVDTVIFAVGDRVDEKLGLPFDGSVYVKNTNPDPDHPGDEAYQVFDPQAGQRIADTFVIGWSRQASDGLVGKAKQDGERGINVVNHFLANATSGTAEGTESKLNALRQLLAERGVRTVDYADVLKLESIEKQEAANQGLEFYKFSANDVMLKTLAD
jgi:ferredoxin/flavodoxin---NADP+ reductase